MSRGPPSAHYSASAAAFVHRVVQLGSREVGEMDSYGIGASLEGPLMIGGHAAPCEANPEIRWGLSLK